MNILLPETQPRFYPSFLAGDVKSITDLNKMLRKEDFSVLMKTLFENAELFLPLTCLINCNDLLNQY